MKKRNLPVFDLLALTVGEVLISLTVIGVSLLLDAVFDVEWLDFSYRVITGAVLGSLVTVLNYLFLTVSVNRAVDKFLELRGSREMTDEEAEKFAAEHSMPIQNAIKTSFIIRTVSMLATLIVAFIVDWFSPVATVVPLLAFRPIMTVCEMIKARLYPTPSESVVVTEYKEINEETEDKTDA